MQGFRGLLSRLKPYSGLFLAGLIFFGLFSFFLWFVHPGRAYQVPEWKVQVGETQLTQNFPYDFTVRGGSEIVLSAAVPPQMQTLVLPQVIADRVEVQLNGENIALFEGHRPFDSWFVPRWVCLDDFVSPGENRVTLRVQSRGRILMSQSPYFQDSDLFLYRLEWFTFFNDEVTLMVMGMCFLLGFLLIFLGRLVPDHKQSYVAIGVSCFFIGLGFLESFYRKLVPLGSFSWILESLKYVYLLLATYLIMYGIESYQDFSARFSRKVLLVNLVCLGLSMIGFVQAFLFAICLDVLLMVFNLVRKKQSKFSLPAMLLALSILYEIVKGFSLRLPSFPMLTYGTFAITLGSGFVLVRDYQKTHQELQATSSELFASYEEMTAMNEELESSYRELDKKVEERTRELNVAISSLQMLMDNTDDGFLSFQKDLLVEPVYSKECRTIFGFDLQGKHFPSLVFPKDPEMHGFLESIFPRILSEDSFQSQEMLISLLPEEAQIKDKTVIFEYRLIGGEGGVKRIMVILRDITERRQLENKIERERNILKMVVHVLRNREDFLETLNDFQEFLVHGAHQIASLTVAGEDRSAMLFRSIHTFKGNFSNFDLMHVVQALHQLETEISKRQQELQAMDPEKWEAFFREFGLGRALQKDLAILKENISPEFFDTQSRCMIHPDRLVSLERKINSELPSPLSEDIIGELRKIRYQSLKELLNHVPSFVNRLALRLGKFVYPVRLEGEDVLVDREYFKGLTKALVHVFRNAVDHGIEGIEERISKGKPEYGSIRVMIRLQGLSVEICVEDDGRGIDLEQVRSHALKKGFLGKECDSDPATNQALIDCLFADSFSTREQVSTVSGRGVGLSALKTELRKMGGEATLETEKGKFTRFCFRVPLNQIKPKRISPEEILGPLVQNSKEYLRKSAAIPEKHLGKWETREADVVDLQAYSAFFTILGAARSVFCISMNHEMAHRLVDSFSLEGISSGEETLLLEDGVAEIGNIILGNSLKSIAPDENLVTFQSPITMHTISGKIRSGQSRVLTTHFHDGEKTLCLYLITDFPEYQGG
ncbi:MAG TPA: ATP-binding protein [Thermotogota bacterium]|nr:ATP-binding protein [Thermotogota bacterium]HRW91705.1 ATP-binding protein [Thermotogota bacterium]